MRRMILAAAAIAVTLGFAGCRGQVQEQHHVPGDAVMDVRAITEDFLQSGFRSSYVSTPKDAGPYIERLGGPDVGATKLRRFLECPKSTATSGTLVDNRDHRLLAGMLLGYCGKAGLREAVGLLERGIEDAAMAILVFAMSNSDKTPNAMGDVPQVLDHLALNDKDPEVRALAAKAKTLYGSKKPQ